MHNGVGIPIARGSGTSGRVQSNKFLPRPQHSPSAAAGAPRDLPAAAAGGIKEEMAEHERRRAVEVRLLELRDVLEEQGHTDAEIASRLAEARKVAAADAATAAGR
ncbi:pre-mRNA-splicing factor CWC21-like [Oryza brachyantha]|nr:pre-mRNA-splicing factor CWC21-like [Oryza brachyantha]